MRSLSAWIGLVFCLGGVALGDAPAPPSLRLSPPRLQLVGPESADQVLVWGANASGRPLDLTRDVQFRVEPEGVVFVTPTGQVTPLQDGRTTITARQGDKTASIEIEVSGVSNPAPVSFRRDVIPILSKAGCNAGGCHGKAEGQNGFRLSIFGYDPAADHQALVQEGLGRRVFPAAPERSLLLQKGTAATPHGGGRKLEAGSRWYRTLRRWIAEGATLDDEGETSVATLEVEPAAITLDRNASQQLRVVSVAADGTRRCVTAESAYQSNNAGIADVDPTGRITATDVPGEAAIVVRHHGEVAVCRVTRPLQGKHFVRPAERNFIDHVVWNKLELLGIAASPPADDATFLRRASLDLIGTLPTPEETRAFLRDTSPEKRRRVVAELLESPLYADHWAQKWADLLQVDKDVVTPEGAVAFTRWIRTQLRQNVPYDEFVRRILTAEGSTLAESPAGFFQVQSDSEKLGRSVAQLFLGVRIECAQCHHHPLERWDQKDFFALAGVFTGVTRKPLALGGVKISDGAATDLKHPRTGEEVRAAPLGAVPFDPAATVSRRRQFATWATASDNSYLARTMVNRLWAHYFGRGLVEPIDDIRDTNPASNEPLLEALTREFLAQKCDVKAFTRTLLDSQVYQLSSRTVESNVADGQNHSRFAWKPLPAEVLLDAVSQATGVPEEFNGWPAGYRAIQVWDNKLPSDFLEIFGRPSRQSVCACERDAEPSIAQALHLMNATGTTAKISSRSGRAARLAASAATDDEVIEELYLSTLSRFPVDAERVRLRQAFTEAGNRREAIEDILWSLLNTKEFVFNH